MENVKIACDDVLGVIVSMHIKDFHFAADVKNFTLYINDKNEFMLIHRIVINTGFYKIVLIKIWLIGVSNFGNDVIHF